MAEWKRIDKTTITEHLRKEEINILQNQKSLALLQQKGNVSHNHRGKDLDFRVRKRRNDMQTYGDAQQVNFDRVNRHEVATLPWGGYIVSESVTKKEKLMNRGREAIVNFVANLTEAMIDDIKYHFQREIYNIDGNAAGNEERIHGFPSFLAVSGNAQYRS